MVSPLISRPFKSKVTASREPSQPAPVRLSDYCPARGANVPACRWGCGIAARAFRRLALAGAILPFVRSLVWIRTEGLENLETLSGPVIFAATHESELDALTILAALPSRWRYRTAVSMADWVFWRDWFGGPRLQTLRYFARVALLNGFTLPPNLAGLRRSLRHMEFLARNGCSILIFPEGAHTPRLLPFQPGVGWAALHLGLPVVPIFVKGMGAILPHGAHLARPGRAHVRFGKAIPPAGLDYRVLSAHIEQQVHALAFE
ncbi:MAG TPA: lysophospholipid acyltransferase family protein [Bryobacteraceae bacterium]|nr:lysophospholipid acyltransferase family protein [Bryobacteraceae bacterium]HUO30795.1 lysophospholipid acyltransferase family protein [Bryobacteraceae bacterium]